VVQGQVDTPLDELGRAQAKAVARVLAATRPSLLLSSDLSRAADTAAPLARATGLVPALDARLRELHLGAWQGLTADQARERFPDEHAAWRAGVDVARGGGETYRQAGERATACLREHLDAVPRGGTVVAVTHGGTARAALGVLLELPDHTWGRLVALGNTCWSVLVESPGGWRLERHGAGVETLDGAAAAAPAGARARAL
jgi:broad specificity phosphatase PhoE